MNVHETISTLWKRHTSKSNNSITFFLFNITLNTIGEMRIPLFSSKVLSLRSFKKLLQKPVSYIYFFLFKKVNIKYTDNTSLNKSRHSFIKNSVRSKLLPYYHEPLPWQTPSKEIGLGQESILKKMVKADNLIFFLCCI